jgi:hypothetical protein
VEFFVLRMRDRGRAKGGGLSSDRLGLPPNDKTAPVAQDIMSSTFGEVLHTKLMAPCRR